MSHVMETLLGLGDVAEMLGLSTGRLRQLIDEGQLPAQKVSGSWILKESDVVAFADRVRPPGRPRLYELILANDEAHIGIRGGPLIGFCGVARRAAFVHGMGVSSSVKGVRLCKSCRSLAPRYVVRYWTDRGAVS